MMNSKTARISVALTVAGALSACAFNDPAEQRFREGWRNGEVVEVVRAAELSRPGFYTCTRTMSEEQLRTRNVAVVKYRRMGKAATHAVVLDEPHQVAVGARVYINIGACTMPPKGSAVSSFQPKGGGHG